MYLRVLINSSLLYALFCLGCETRCLQTGHFGFSLITVIPSRDSYLESVAANEFKYLGYRWQIIDAKQSFLELSDDNRSIRNIQKNREGQLLDKEIKLTVIDFPPFIALTDVNNSLELGGYFGEVFNIFKTKFNTSFKVIRNKHNQFGAVINGSWSGMIGDLAQGTAHISSGIIMNRQRANSVNFSPQFYPILTEIMYRKLDQHETIYGFYLQPFSVEMWLWILSITVLVLLVIVVANYISKRKQYKNCFLNCINDVLLCWPIVLQGSFYSFTLKSTKFFFGIYIAFSMLMSISYNSAMTSLLATTDIKFPFSSLDDMYENTDYLPMVLKGSSDEETFQKAPYASKIVLRVGTPRDGIEKAYGGKFGFIISFQNIQHLIRGNCSFAVASNYVSKRSVSFGYSKKFVYMEYFNYKSLLLKQCGILSKIFQDFYTDLHTCFDNQFNPVSFGQIIGPFIFLMGAILMSLVIGVIELIIEEFIL